MSIHPNKIGHVTVLEVTREYSRIMERRFSFKEATYVYCCLSLLIGADVNAGKLVV